jgi:hypothetical protein
VVVEVDQTRQDERVADIDRRRGCEAGGDHAVARRHRFHGPTIVDEHPTLENGVRVGPVERRYSSSDHQGHCTSVFTVDTSRLIRVRVARRRDQCGRSDALRRGRRT